MKQVRVLGRVVGSGIRGSGLGIGFGVCEGREAVSGVVPRLAGKEGREGRRAKMQMACGPLGWLFG